MARRFGRGLEHLLGHDLDARGGSGEDDFRVLDDFGALFGGLAVDGFEVDAEAFLRHGGALDDAVDAAVGDELDLGALEGRDDRGGEADDAGGAEYGDASSLPGAAELELQDALDAGDHGGRRREGAGGVSERGALEGGDERLLGGVEHVERHDGVLAAHEKPGAHTVVRRAGEYGVLDQRRDVLHFDIRVGDDDLEAGVGGHVHVEWADVLARVEHVQDGRRFLGHFLGLPGEYEIGSGGADDGAGVATLHNFQIEPRRFSLFD